MDNNNNTSNNNCIIGLCVYNNEPGLPSVLTNILKISESKLFEKITVVAFYDYSSDKSHSIMEKFKSQYSNIIEMVIIINKSGAYRQMRMELGGANRVLDKNRTARIALARNGILNYIRSQRSKGAYNKYFIMMDSNEYACVGKINIETLRSALNRSDEWDSISFDREAGYYDYWALSFDPHIYSFYHVENRNETLNNMVTSFATKLKNAKNANAVDKQYDKQYDLIPVYSSYNGFAIYKTDAFLNCTYSSDININLFPKQLLPSKILNNFKNDCEHRKFHLEAIKKNNARIVVSPLSIFYKLPIKNPALRGPA
jgi:hypothetical protein